MSLQKKERAIGNLEEKERFKMSKIIDAINGLPDLLTTGEVDGTAIANAEKELGLKFAREYKEYLGKFGSVLAEDVEITGIAKSKNRNVISVTQREWGLNPLVEHNMYVVENLAIDGIIIWQDETGNIFESVPNKTLKKVADSLADYILSKN